ncbi:MAG: nicotinamide riboside transporter PnuC [Burkholderiaceae bacterium]
MFETLFTVLGTPVTTLEVLAFVLALACVALNIFEIHWAWPLAIASSLLYGWLFVVSMLYGEASLQVVFAVVALWGWWQWLYGNARPGERRAMATEAPGETGALRVGKLGGRARLLVLLAWGLGWGLIGLALDQLTDSDVPFYDAFPTAGSLVGQYLLGRKFLENWHVWIGVNLVSIGLFAYKQLWLTAILYAVFVVLAVAGLKRWRAILRASAAARA